MGEFVVRSEVTPREIARGGAVGVTLTIEGRGNFPNRLLIPTVRGAEWLEPEVSDRFGPDGEDRFGGARTFKYVVRLGEPGTVALGAVTFPHFSPRTKKYEIARSDLGSVTVTPDGRASAPDDTKVDLLPNLPKPRGGLEGGVRAEIAPISDRPAAWLLVFASPFAFVVAVALGGLGGRLRSSREAKKASPEAELTKRLREAERAIHEKSWDIAVRAALTVLEQGAVVKLGVSLRGRSALG